MEDQDTISFEQIRLEPAYQIIADAVEKRILAGDIRPGERLPSEQSLAQQFGVNRSTVREGIRVLEQNGLVSREGRRRLVATVPRYQDLSTRIQRAMILQDVTFLELWETMLSLEPMAAELAALRIEDEEVGVLEDNLQKTTDAASDHEKLVALDIEFHLNIARAAKNKALLLAREPIGLLFYPTFYSVMSRLNAGPRLFRAHEEIVNGIKQHDAKHARDWMEKHIRDFRRGYELANLDMTEPVDHEGAA